jgi:hypothetical protein
VWVFSRVIRCVPQGHHAYGVWYGLQAREAELQAVNDDLRRRLSDTENDLIATRKLLREVTDNLDDVTKKHEDLKTRVDAMDQVVVCAQCNTTKARAPRPC